MGVAVLSAATPAGATECAAARYSIEVIASGQRLKGMSWTGLPASAFKNFVAAVSLQVLARRGVPEACLALPGEPAATQLVFVHEALVVSDHGAGAQIDADKMPHPAGGTCQLASPWLQVTTDAAPGGALHAVFRWSERQFLRDQVALAGGVSVVPGRGEPIAAARFDALAQDYAETVLLVAEPQAKPAAQRAVAQRIPADLLWLFRQAWQSTFMPFPVEARDALDLLITRAAPGYAAMVQALLDQSLQPGAVPHAYAGLGELPAAMKPDAYRIDRLH